MDIDKGTKVNLLGVVTDNIPRWLVKMLFGILGFFACVEIIAKGFGIDRVINAIVQASEEAILDPKTRELFVDRITNADGNASRFNITALEPLKKEIKRMKSDIELLKKSYSDIEERVQLNEVRINRVVNERRNNNRK